MIKDGEVNNKNKNRFWKKSYDAGLSDLNPSEFEITNIDALKGVFKEFPNKLAVEYLGVHISYKELDEYSNQFANMLIEQGFKVGDIVGICLANMPQYIITWLGCLKAGCTISGISPLLSEEQLAFQLKDLASGGKRLGFVTLDAIFAARLINFATDISNLKLIVTTNIADMLPKIKRILAKALKKVPKGKVRPIEGKSVLKFLNIIDKYDKTSPSVDISPDDLMYIQYTGGTTGNPKGAMLTHKSTVADMLIIQRWLGWDDRRGLGIALSGFPFFHIAGVFFAVNCIFLGWTQILIPNPRDTDYICDKIEEFKPTDLVNVPSLFQLLLKNPKFQKLKLSYINTCITAASPFPEESQKQLEAVVGSGKLIECYGMTETSPLTTMNPVKGKKKLGTIGIPLLNVDLKLIDPATKQEVPIGEPGEICVKGPMVMKGYYNQPEETKKVFDDQGYLHTGDVAVFDEEGYLRIVDRTKDMINVSGYKVFSKKVEETLSEHPAIDMIALVAVKNPERPGSELVKAFISLDPNYTDEDDVNKIKGSIIDFAKEQCAPYEVPKMIEIRQELPLTTVGKIDKKILRKE
ncbi:MAG: AMP-binding protein [Candidatus Lokiarchaeota archaeon]|nr:AMP-binding protein [Candidatus Lokiarchaeota archaeon]